MGVVSGALLPSRRRVLGRVREALSGAPMLAVGILTTLVFVAVFAPLVAPHDPLRPVPGVGLLAPPVWQGGSWSTPLGTDFQGRDVLSRVIYGARVSLTVGVVGTVVAGFIGLVFGVVAGYLGGWVDQLAMRVIDAWLALPSLIFAVFVALVMRPSQWTIVVILGLVYWTRYARVIRGEVLSLRERDFVRLAEVAGASRWRIMRRHIVPNILNTWMVLASLTVGVVIILEASLSFLGLGIPAPTPAWGSMVADARALVFAGQWWHVAAPGVLIAATVFATNMLGDWLRVRLDPKQRNL
ncbi:MAG: ABC transporter permease subunit [Acidimicrobiia bacterium]|nr:ABC transporter permease subunit [Acidimicrobiia bacterium]